MISSGDSDPILTSRTRTHLHLGNGTVEAAGGSNATLTSEEIISSGDPDPILTSRMGRERPTLWNGTVEAMRLIRFSRPAVDANVAPAQEARPTVLRTHGGKRPGGRPRKSKRLMMPSAPRSILAFPSTTRDQRPQRPPQARHLHRDPRGDDRRVRTPGLPADPREHSIEPPHLIAEADTKDTLAAGVHVTWLPKTWLLRVGWKLSGSVSNRERHGRA